MEYAGNIYSEQYCEKEGVTAATNPVSCIGNTLYTIISIISLVLLPIVAVKYRKRFIFHTNVLILTYNFFAASFLHAFLFAITQLCVPVVQVVCFLGNETFSVPTVNAFYKPDTLVQSMRAFFIASIATNVLSLSACAVLHLVNRRKRLKPDFTLSSRFQSEENASSILLVLGILAIHFIVYILFRISYLLINLLVSTEQERMGYQAVFYIPFPVHGSTASSYYTIFGSRESFKPLPSSVSLNAII
ncbi:hypothetical protein NECAME_09825 [Necator americanus]|uniref:Uncharacterized protein n=1 Tax=Necator americanus TaxID=51031 RepID=W2TEJ5_NECAM|nr:hypothetical protein NECAME_09825 [Necator americanus]ETN79422.1 hypothetical protein NECAME_09825 [Necator americanus]